VFGVVHGFHVLIHDKSFEFYFLEPAACSVSHSRALRTSQILVGTLRTGGAREAPALFHSARFASSFSGLGFVVAE